MIEKMGPAMAKSIMGDAYSPEYRYELETTDEGLQVIVTNKQTGEASVVKLTDDPTESSHYDPIYEEEAIRARGEYTKRGWMGLLAAMLICIAFIGAVCLAVYFFKPT